MTPHFENTGKTKLVWSVTVLLLTFSNGIAQIKPALIFSDHAVLQRNTTVPVWGTSQKGDRITVSFQGKEFKTKANRSGKWSVSLPPMQAGGPYEMIIQGRSEKVVIRNLMIGDVWVCSGQSNMEWELEFTNEAEKEIAAANFDNIRHFKVPLSSAMSPEDQLAGGEWESCNSKTAGDFTAVGYYFAKELVSENNVPIGLLNTSWGGSRIEPWMSAKALGYTNVEEVQKKIIEKREKDKAERVAALKEKLPEIPLTDKGIRENDTLWAKVEWQDETWKKMELPGLWEGKGWPTLDGVVWYRKQVELNEEAIKQDMELSLGPIDDTDQTWINGHYVGGLVNSYNVARKYIVPKEYLVAGTNLITIRVDDTGGGGGLSGAEEDMYLKFSTSKISLAGEWKFKIGQVYLESMFSDNQVPTLLYNKMVYPLLNFPIKGVIWYQGESNAENEKDAYAYASLFKNMIKSWRSEWGNKEFPFLHVQLANFMAPPSVPSESAWAILRESQSSVLELPNTGQAVIIDIGEADDIHPRNKKDVGQRLAAAAKKLAYNKDIVFSGPVYKSMEIKGNEIVLSFEHIGSGLHIKDKYGYLKGFSIAGKDKKFVWAKARIEGNNVIVYNDTIGNPVAVRYAWANNPDDANLYNKEGFPASPFRTDKKTE